MKIATIKTRKHGTGCDIAMTGFLEAEKTYVVREGKMKGMGKVVIIYIPQPNTCSICGEEFDDINLPGQGGVCDKCLSEV